MYVCNNVLCTIYSVSNPWIPGCLLQLLKDQLVISAYWPVWRGQYTTTLPHFLLPTAPNSTTRYPNAPNTPNPTTIPTAQNTNPSPSLTTHNTPIITYPHTITSPLFSLPSIPSPSCYL